MYKKYNFKIIFLFVLSLTILMSCKNTKNTDKTVLDAVSESTEINIFIEETAPNEVIDIFENDMFINIFSEPELYKNNAAFSFNEYFPNFIQKGTPEKYIEIENDEIKIVYYPHDFSLNGNYIIQSVTLKKRNDKYFLGNFFGRTSEEILQRITNIPNYIESGQISYVSAGYIYFVTFMFMNGKIDKIIYGHNI
jgi:hypothetical protein